MYGTGWGGRLGKRFYNMCSEISTGSWAELQLPGYPSRQGELPDNMLQNLLLNLPPQTVICDIFRGIGLDCKIQATFNLLALFAKSKRVKGGDAWG